MPIIVRPGGGPGPALRAQPVDGALALVEAVHHVAWGCGLTFKAAKLGKAENGTNFVKKSLHGASQVRMKVSS